MSESIAILWTVTCQAPLFMEFPRQEYWNGLPFPSPENLPNPGLELTSLSLAEGFFTIELPGKPQTNMFDFLWPHGLQPSRLLCPWDSSGKNTREGCHALFQGIFLAQGSNPHLLHCRQIFTSEPLEEPH